MIWWGDGDTHFPTGSRVCHFALTHVGLRDFSIKMTRPYAAGIERSTRGPGGQKKTTPKPKRVAVTRGNPIGCQPPAATT
jgi:hypothetical protein